MINEIVVFRRDNKWFTGTIKDDKLRKKKQIKKLSDVTDTHEYSTLKKWMKDTKNTSEADDLLTQFKVQSLYIKKVEPVIVKSEGETVQHPTAKQFWAKFNSICIKCKNKCKQSSYAEILNCNSMQLK